jgi:ATP-dependent RNA helicase CshB
MAARGLDINNVTDILSVDLPPQVEFYMHRAGRTGRYKEDGDSYLFYKRDANVELNKLAPFNVTFDYLMIRDGQIVPQKQRSIHKSTTRDTELDRDIRKAIRQTKSKEVKPGYKKKVKEAVAKVKSKHRRAQIKGKIREQLDKQYRNKPKGE